MKLNKLLLRWYKSFHQNYRGDFGKDQGAYRPWNKMSPSFVPDVEFPFIEIPIERDITTIVGANESGKSHLLNAISKVVRGVGLEADDSFKQTDLCHYAGVRTRNVEAWPNVGLYFTLDDDQEARSINKIVEGAFPEEVSSGRRAFALILAPEDDEQNPARLFAEPNQQPMSLSKKQLAAIRKFLPAVQFIDSGASLSSEIPLSRLIAGFGDKELDGAGLLDRRSVEHAMSIIQSISIPAAQQVVSAGQAKAFEEAKAALAKIVSKPPAANSLEMLLFRDILGIRLETLKFLYGLPASDRGYIEGQIGKWNEEMANHLNLSHFWHQDEQFSLSVNYKDGIVYFEIRDKTDSIYTFRERSSGLRFFLSYYVQARALEMTSRNRNSIILMDEPDSALSILGQRNLLAVFESLVSPESSNGTCQLVYTTHSPYLINRNFPRRIRVVKKEDAEEGTQYIERARSRRYEPVRTALGIDSAPSLFLGADNVLLEGPTDQYLLVELVRVFSTPENVGQFLNLNTVVTVSADGAGNVESVLGQSTWADEPIPPTVVLLDSDQAAKDVVNKIAGGGSRKKLIDRAFVGMIGELVPAIGSARVVTIEDIVPRTIYVDAIKAYITKWMPEIGRDRADYLDEFVVREDFGLDGLAEAAQRLFKEIDPGFGGGYDKMGVLQQVVSIAEGLQASEPENANLILLKRNVIAICDFARDQLEKSRAAAARHSTTQAVKRIIHDFSLLNRGNVQITSLQTLFKRIGREATPIGTDGEALFGVVMRYLVDLDKLRSAGQERVTGEDWSMWSSRIEKMRRNPLSVSVEEENPLVSSSEASAQQAGRDLSPTT